MRRFICVCLYFVCFSVSYCIVVEHGGVSLMGLKPNPLDLKGFQCFDTVGLVI